MIGRMMHNQPLWSTPLRTNPSPSSGWIEDAATKLPIMLGTCDRGRDKPGLFDTDANSEPAGRY
jgi:hypothetical protein